MKNLKVLFTVLCVACATTVWGEDFTTSYSYGNFTGWSLTNYSDKSSYYLVPSGTSPSVATISGIFTNKTITSDVVITINCATYGNGTNPSASTFSVYAEDGCTTSITATQGGTLPTSSTYTDVVYTVNEQNTTKLTKDLAIKITKPGKQIRLKSIKVVFSYTDSSGSTETTPSITQHPKSATYDQGATPAALTITASGSPDPTYQWYSNTSNNNSNGTAISGATEASYTPSTATAGTFYYYCVATNSKGSTSSDVATITVNTITTYTVLWSLGGAEYTEGAPTTSVKSGEKVSTLPTRPANNAIGSCADTFMGWSAHNLGSKTGQDAPKDLFTTAEGSPVITQDTTFYAVFATGTTN